MKKLSLIFLCFVSVCASGQKMPEADNGVLDVRTWNFHQKKVALNGQWHFYKNEFVSISTKTPGVTNFPETWDPSTQYGTYQLRVILPTDTINYAIELPQIYCSYQLWVNDNKIAENGTTGTTKETTIPQWLPQYVSFRAPDDTLFVVLQISNFYHHKGGSKEPLYLGSAEMIKDHHEIAVESNLIESFGLALLGLGFLLIYYLREERKKITLYFSLLCISWALRSEFSNLYTFISYFPDFSWGWMVRIEYITLFLTMIWAILFMSRLFPNESSKTIKYILVCANCAFIALTALALPVFFTRWLDVYLSVAGVLLVFCVIIAIRAWINERSGARYVVACVFLSLVLFGYDIFIYEGWLHYYNAVFFNVGYLSIFMMMGVSLLYHLQIFKSESSGMLTYEDLYGKSK